MTLPLVVLGATGSIGRQTLEVAAHLGVEVTGLAVGSVSPGLIDLARAHPGAAIAIAGGAPSERGELRSVIGDRVEFGTEAVVALAAMPGRIVVNGVVGAAGLRASVTALEAGNRLALANKESLVAGGPVITRLLESGSGELIPVDSEHSAVFQLIAAHSEVERIVLTASGGPFRGRAKDELEDVTPADALRHPTWEMGRRITVDSATLVNKGLEVIEAHVLFGLPYDRIDVVVHPQSIVHSMVVTGDGALMAHLGITDMRVPIQYAITHPRRLPPPVPPFSLVGKRLDFEEPDRRAFPGLDLAYAAGRRGDSAPAVYNAADEVAVEAFLAGKLGFLGIPEVIERTLDAFDHRPLSCVDDVVAADAQARMTARSLLGGVC